MSELLRTIEVKVPRQANRLQVFGLRGECVGGLSDATRDEAIEAETLEITEVSASG